MLPTFFLGLKICSDGMSVKSEEEEVKMEVQIGPQEERPVIDEDRHEIFMSFFNRFQGEIREHSKRLKENLPISMFSRASKKELSTACDFLAFTLLIGAQSPAAVIKDYPEEDKLQKWITLEEVLRPFNILYLDVWTNTWVYYNHDNDNTEEELLGMKNKLYQCYVSYENFIENVKNFSRKKTFKKKSIWKIFMKNYRQNAQLAFFSPSDKIHQVVAESRRNIKR